MQGFRLSPQQRHLWSLQGEGSVDAAQAVLLLEGELEREALRRAVASAVARFEILRTTFRRPFGVKVPLQRVAEAAEPVWTEVEGADEALSALLPEERGRLSLDAPGGSLLRAALVRLGTARHALVLTLPALCADVRSLANLAAEIAAAYAGTDPGEEPVQFVQFSEWQHEALEDPDNAAGRQHWRELDLSAMLPLRLPFAMSVGEIAPEPERLRVRLEPGLAPEPDVLLACWQLLLGRLTGQPDVVVGVVCDGRTFEELGAALGLFARAVPVHARWEPGFRFSDVLRRVRQARSKALGMQELLVRGEEGVSPRGIEGMDVGFEVVEVPPAVQACGVAFSLRDGWARIDRWRLALVCVLDGGALALDLVYDPRSVPGPAAACLAARLVALLGEAAARPDAAVGDLDDVGAAERHWLLRELNDTASAAAAEPVHARFERWARLRPERPALRFEEREITYDELNRRANRLAHRLRRLGVGTEVIVPLLAERSIEAITGLLAVLKAGGAYLPLDPAAPAPRLAALLEPLRAPVLLAQAELAGKLPAQGGRLVLLDEDPGESDDNPSLWALPESAAYVLFTSGSTGRPKGVVVEHRQLAQYVDAVAGRLGLGDLGVGGASYALVSTLAADLGNTVLYPALSTGGTLHVISAARAADPEAYAEYAGRHRIDCLKIVPTHFAALLQAERAEQVVPRELLVLGGEACSWDLVDRVARLAPSCRVLNHYGPTETTVGVTTQPLAPAPWLERPERPGRPPLGLPLANVQAHVLGPNGGPVAVGAAGELFLGGASVSRGYLGRPELTAERFVPDPFAAEPGARLYRSGDLVRRAPDGRLEFAGRADGQVKLRGFRIELGEIEAALAALPQVRAAAAMLREDEPEKPRIVAYVVASGALGPRELREALIERLPEPMVPSAFVLLDALPLTPNGKLDRRALPAPEFGSGERAAYVVPGTEMEARLAAIWQEVLGLDRIGVSENFFALGGDSILAIQVIARARKAGLELQPWQLFRHQTIADLAAAAARGARDLRAGEGLGEPPIVPVGREGDLPLSYAQERLWFVHQLDPESFAFNIPRAVRLLGDLDPAALAGALQALAARHESLRTRFPAREGTPVQEIAPAPDLRLAFVDLSGLPAGAAEPEARRIAADAARRPFDLAAGPLARAALLKLEEGDHLALFVLHHVISDAWSMAVLIRELVALYEAGRNERENRAARLPILPVQYADFAHWQRRRLEAGALDSQLAYWKEKLSGAPETLSLAADFPRPEAQTFRGAFHPFTLSPELSRTVQRLGREEGTTLFMTLLAGFVLLLSRSGAGEDVVVGTDLVGRNRIELDGILGFFVNNLVLRTDLSGNPTFRELLQRVREVALGAFANQDLPFDRLVKELRPRRTLRQTPLFQVLFVMQNVPLPPLRFAGVELRPVELDFGMSKFDLALFMAERPEGLGGVWHYSTDLFRPETVVRTAARFVHLLESAATQPDVRLSEIETLAPDERESQERARREREESALGKLRSIRGRRAAEELR
ncbi:MAG TPA: amino acid adenylation domain-containing protein [Thermoanaerobaculia bacterium]|nr:amino acid adenylation domain-containing protein [Thermoanaerobaculia bacterium]